MSEQQGKSRKRGSAIPGLAALGCLVTGVAGLVHAFLFEGGTALIASALAFGILTYTSFR